MGDNRAHRLFGSLVAAVGIVAIALYTVYELCTHAATAIDSDTFGSCIVWLVVVTAVLIGVLFVPVPVPVAARACLLAIPALVVGSLGFMGESPGYGRVPSEQLSTVHSLVGDVLGGLLFAGLWLFGFAIAIAFVSLAKIAMRRARG